MKDKSDRIVHQMQFSLKRERNINIPSSLLGMLIIAFMLCGCINSGYSGFVYERFANGSIGPIIPGTEVIFTREDGVYSRDLRSAADGSYFQSLPPARYVVTAFHPHYNPYSSEPDFFVVQDDTYHTGNIFLQRRNGTVILLVRHAEKASDDANTNLAVDPNNQGLGLGRAEALARLVSLLNVQAVYTTDFCRTAQTGQPSALAYGFPLRIQILGGSQAGLKNCNPAIVAVVDNLPNNLSSPESLAMHLLNEWTGDTILIVGHSNTVPPLATALGAGSLCPNYLPGSPNNCVIPENEYHNMFILFIPSGGGPTEVTHRAYGFQP